MKNVAIYVRVSTEEQKKGLSIDNQIEALQQYAEDHDYRVVGIYNDAGYSARKSYKKRPALQKLLADCQAGKIQLILFTRLDRWGRSVGDYYQIQAILDENNVAWRAIWEDYNTEDSAGVFKVNIMLSIAQAEADRTSEKIKSVMQYKIAHGEYVGAGRIQLGYKRYNKGIIIDEETKEGVQAFFREYLNTFNSACARAKAFEYGLDISPKKSHFMLKDPAYTGHLQNCTFEPYISQEEHELILKSFNARRTRVDTKTKSTHVFSGLLRCECCGRNLLVKKSDPRHTGVQYVYYMCTVSQTHKIYTSEKKLEAWLLDQLQPEFDKYRIEAEIMSGQAVDHSAEIKKLEAKLKRVGIRFEEGDISEEEYKLKRDLIKSDIEILKAQAPAEPRSLDLPSDWRSIYQDLDDNHKRAFWSSAFDHITIPLDKEAPPRISF